MPHLRGKRAQYRSRTCASGSVGLLLDCRPVHFRSFAREEELQLGCLSGFSFAQAASFECFSAVMRFSSSLRLAYIPVVSGKITNGFSGRRSAADSVYIRSPPSGDP